MTKLERLRIACSHVNSSYNKWVCGYGEWNADKIAEEVERKLRENRRNK